MVFLKKYLSNSSRLKVKMFYEYCKSGKFFLMLHQIPKSQQRQKPRKVGGDADRQDPQDPKRQ